MVEENLKWNQDTMPSEILKLIFDQELKDENRTENNIHAIGFAYGKALAMEELLDVRPKKQP
jgi:predicted secreted Zn-dependent protease